MAIKDSGKVTVTLNRTTVEKLRAEKGVEAWDAFMLDLIENRKQGVRARCIICDAFIQTTDVNISPSELAKRRGWEEMYSGRVYLNRDGVRTKVELGFICDKCVEVEDAKALELEAKANPGDIVTLE